MSDGHGVGNRVLMLGGQPLHQMLRLRAPELARQLTEIIAAHVTTYNNLPDEELQRDIVSLVELNLNLVANTFEHHSPPKPEEMELLWAAAGRGAQDLTPLEDIMTAYHLGGRQATVALFADAAPEDYGDIVEAYSLLLKYNQVVSTVVCEGYMVARESMRSQEQDARHAVVSALLNGERPMNAGALAGVRLASRYLVFTAAIGKHPDEADDKPFAVYAGRSKLDRIRTVLDGFASEPALTVLDPAGGLILAPASDSMMDWKGARELVAVVGQAAGAPVWIAGQLATIEEVPAAARLTQEVLDVVRLFGRPPGLYQLSDVLLEYQLTRPSHAMEELASLLDPLAEHPDLQRTLEVYVENGLDRRQAAALLHVHPNTVDYRLRRVVALTGLDPVDPVQLQRIGAALAARRKRVAKPDTAD
ncbi:PucR family transcriptional regulator [Stackebrandtia nassauensis]|uniref:Putative transcriptional regulator, PucR family n=1 Tax=Stackebrandtia nassauensis (strain DSM 44728 / CIP 108903 / NRRL B-16338 / NBRC 102104 / LLR-40K-21) TaxID=446470 RepID=D3Q4F0_STANL|nr:helix-turn-helix domain-containing protein [Stackebrandtia nassauensis]ADD40110.1 putative transcriptional regulator, PucR family [Stackebrandtia nassauensis DSM 44728]